MTSRLDGTSRSHRGIRDADLSSWRYRNNRSGFSHAESRSQPHRAATWLEIHLRHFDHSVNPVPLNSWRSASPYGLLPDCGVQRIGGSVSQIHGRRKLCGAKSRCHTEDAFLAWSVTSLFACDLSYDVGANDAVVVTGIKQSVGLRHGRGNNGGRSGDIDFLPNSILFRTPPAEPVASESSRPMSRSGFSVWITRKARAR